MPVVKFYAGLRKTAGAKEIAVSGSTLHNVLDVLVSKTPLLQQEIWDGTALRPHVLITINGQAMDPQHDLQTAVNADDVIAIFPPIAGG